MDGPFTEALSAFTLVVGVLGIGMTWQKSKSRAEESARLIALEAEARKESTARVERLIEVNNTDARRLVAEAEARGMTQFQTWASTRKAVDDAQAAASLSQSNLLQALTAQMGKLEGMMIMMMHGKVTENKQ